jgi:hypothetical protein
MMGANLAAELHGQVWSVGIDRPEKRNALNGPLFEAVTYARGSKVLNPDTWTTHNGPPTLRAFFLPSFAAPFLRWARGQVR